MVLCHLPGLALAHPASLVPKAGGWGSPGLAACVQILTHSSPQAWLGSLQPPRPSPPLWSLALGEQYGSPRAFPPSGPSLPPGQYCSQRKCPV